MKCQILFYGCEAGRASSLQFAAAFADKVPLTKVNEWNHRKRFGKAFLDSDNDMCFQMDMDMDGGVTQANLEEYLKRWRSVLVSFVAFMSQAYLAR